MFKQYDGIRHRLPGTAKWRREHGKHCNSSAVPGLFTHTKSLVAGCSLMFNPDAMLLLSNMGFLSHDSRSFSFDHRANGYGRGEGAGMVVLKRLSDANRDGDTIRAVVRSTGSNQDGRTPGITQPDRNAQESLIKETYQKAGLDMGCTKYFEAHGTGTKIGDSTEASAIGRAFRKYRSANDPLYV